MKDYAPLQKLFYQEKASERNTVIRDEALRRLNEGSTFRSGISIATGELFLAVPRELTMISERLFRVERRVSKLWRELPGIARWAYIRGLIMGEIVSTNEIEGVYSTRRQIEEALESVASQKITPEGKRFKEFARLYMQLTDGSRRYPESPKDIRIIYDAIMEGELTENLRLDGELFRKEAADVVSSHQEVIHSGVMPESKIVVMLEQLIGLINSSKIPPTFSAIIAHFLFEYIHPFYDGNGRTGRYLLSLYLSEPLSLPTVLSLSTVIAENKNRYYKAFKAAESPLNYGELTFFVIQIMEFIRAAQDSTMEDLEEKVTLLMVAEQNLNELRSGEYSLSPKETDVMFQALQYHLFDVFSEISLANIADNMDVSKQTARKYVAALEEKGLLKAISSKPYKFILTPRAEKELVLATG
ncbi:MAG TPA: Fic family protein [Coriobacteriia bacterium]|nr:Fic family protein [Coriobacteriia bacterium]